MSGQPGKEEIVQHFQLLCNQQRQLQTKLAEIRMERGEHEIVAETLKNVPAERKCWRLVGLSFFIIKWFQTSIGGVLTERKVSEVLPALENQVTGLANVMSSLEQQMNIKAKGI